MTDRYVDMRYKYHLNTCYIYTYIHYKRLFSCIWHEMLKLHLICSSLSHQY